MNISLCLSVYLSVCLSVCLSVTPFSLCSSHRIIIKLPGVITIDKIDIHATGPGQRSKVQITEVKTPFRNFWTVTPVCIHIRQWNDAQSLMLLRRGVLMFFKVICQISRSHGTKNCWFWPKIGSFQTVTRVEINRWFWNDAQSLK